MTKFTALSFDPGKITGLAGGHFTETEPLTVDLFQTITYGEFANWYDELACMVNNVDYVVVEEFILRAGNPFAADLTGVKVEGMIDIARGDVIHRRNRTHKSQVPDQVLKDHGLWKTGGEVDWEDGRDVNDATIHLLGFVAFDLKHVPTLRKYFR